RWISGGIAGIVVIAAMATFFAFGGTSAPRGGARHGAPRSQPVAPLVQGPDPGSTGLASWGGGHAGWVFMCGDGRVIWSPSKGVFVDADGRVTWHPDVREGYIDAATGTIWYAGRRTRDPVTHVTPEGVLVGAVIERQLSTRGLTLLRTGKLNPKHL